MNYMDDIRELAEEIAAASTPRGISKVDVFAILQKRLFLISFQHSILKTEVLSGETEELKFLEEKRALQMLAREIQKQKVTYVEQYQDRIGDTTFRYNMVVFNPRKKS